MMKKNKTVIEPPSTFSLNIKELWQYRELFYFFTWRDIKVKYKQTYLGVAWALLQPLTLMVLFVFVFKRFNMNTGNIRYEIYVLSGLIFWNLFNASISNASGSIIEQSNIIKKIYFPRLIIPCSSILVALFDFILSFFVFILFCFLLQQPLHWDVFVYFPLSLLLTLFAVFGLGTLLSALTIKFRDFRYVIPFLLQFLFFASQVIYSLNDFTNEVFRYTLALNPMNGILELFRGSFGVGINFSVVLISMASTLLLNLAGLIYFRKTEAYFADLS